MHSDGPPGKVWARSIHDSTQVPRKLSWDKPSAFLLLVFGVYLVWKKNKVNLRIFSPYYLEKDNGITDI